MSEWTPLTPDDELRDGASPVESVKSPDDGSDWGALAAAYEGAIDEAATGDLDAWDQAVGDGLDE